MDTLLLANYDSVGDAAAAYNELVDGVVDDQEISVITTETVKKEFVAETDADVDDDTTVAGGAVSGAIGGGLLGLLVSAAPVLIAGLPSLIVVGPISAALGLTGVAATTTTGAAAGALAGGLYGAFDNLGVDEDTAREYENTVKEGGVLLAVSVNGNEDEIREVLDDSNANSVSLGSVNR